MGNYINWKKMSPRRRAALAITCDSCTRFLMKSEHIEALMSDPDGDQHEAEKEENDIRGELILDILSKSGITLRAREAILECFAVANDIHLSTNSKEDLKMKTEWKNLCATIRDGNYKFLAIVPIYTFNNHNYPVNYPCIVIENISHLSVSAMRVDGTIGNHLPVMDQPDDRKFTMPTLKSLIEFFGTRIPLQRIDHFYKSAALSTIGNDIDRCEQYINGYKNIITNKQVIEFIHPI